MAPQHETLEKKIILAVVDKLLLGLVVAFFAGAITFFADRLQTTWSFQDELFAKRFSVYSEIARNADSLLGTLHYYYNPVIYKGPYLYRPWSYELNDIRDRASRLRWSGSSSSGIISSVEVEDVVEKLHDLEQTWEQNILFVPPGLNDTFDTYMNVVVSDLNQNIEERVDTKDRQGSSYSERIREKDAQRWERAYGAHKGFLRDLRKTIGLDISPDRPFDLKDSLS